MTKMVHREPWSKEGIERDLVTGQYTFTTEENDGDYTIHPVGLRIEHHKHERFTIREGDPLSAGVETAHSHKIERGEWGGGAGKHDPRGSRLAHVQYDAAT